MGFGFVEGEGDIGEMEEAGEDETTGTGADDGYRGFCGRHGSKGRRRITGDVVEDVVGY